MIYTPSAAQAAMLEGLVKRPRTQLVAGMGTGKTGALIVHACSTVLQYGRFPGMLVLAPPLVCLAWAREIPNWAPQLRVAVAGAQPGLAQYEISSETGAATYLWPQGPKDILGAPIRDAYYEFFKDQFYHVWINFDGQAAYEKALAGLIRAYGPPTQENRDKFYHAWQLGEVNIYCAYHRDLNEGDVSFFYQPLYERMIAARKAAGAKAPPRSAKK